VVAQHKTTRKTSKRRTSSKSLKKAAPRRARAASVKRTKSEKNPKAVGDEEVTIDRRRGSRREENASSAAKPVAAAPTLERRQKVNRRRQIDPTTCERDYTDQEVEFMNALDDYKRKSGRMFPTCSEVLEVIRSLGYIKLSPAESATRLDAAAPAGSAKPMPADWTATPTLSAASTSAETTPALQQ
jgi:hypothetical protein